MPRFDGTGPQGKGPFSGRGEGYCAVAQPDTDKPYGFMGLQGTPFSGLRFMRRLRQFGAGRRGTGRGRGRGRRARW